MKIHDSETYLKINAEGENNYTILRKQPAGPESAGAVGLALSNVSLNNTAVHYFDLRTLQDFTFTSTNLVASIHSTKDIYDIQAKGHLNTDKMLIGANNYLAGKSFEIESHLIYDDDKKHLTIHPSDLKLKKSSFSVSGTYGWKDKNIIHLATAGTDTDIKTLF